MKKIQMLPNLITLGNAFCGLLALSYGIDALALSVDDPALFYSRLERACWLIVLAGVLDGLDGKVARITKSTSDFGAQLDSFADALTFGIAPALLAKVMLEHEGPLVGSAGHPRLHFIACAAFALMAILRLARFNLETDHDQGSHDEFRGLPSPAAAGAVISSLLMYLHLRTSEPSTPHLWALGALGIYLPVLGLLMVSRVRYVHLVSLVTGGRSNFFSLVSVVFALLIFFIWPREFLFASSLGFVLFGLFHGALDLRRRRAEAGRSEP